MAVFTGLLPLPISSATVDTTITRPGLSAPFPIAFSSKLNVLETRLSDLPPFFTVWTPGWRKARSYPVALSFQAVIRSAKILKWVLWAKTINDD